jgi:NAD(P)-dependent dehydrogenase (short-subunit alcohol dehydrogenase family)
MILKDKVVIVTGVGPGMGRNLALAVAREGAKAVLAARSKAFIEGVRDEIAAGGGQAIAVVTDVGELADCQALAQATIKAFGRIDGLVNSAYYHPAFTTFEDCDIDEWRKAVDIVSFGALRAIRAVLPQMKAQGGGSIVNIGTLATRKPMIGEGGYAMGKAALGQVTRQLAVEFGAYNIRVNQPVMGWMWGAPLEGFFDGYSKSTGRSLDDLKGEVAARIPLGRIPKDEDCAKAVLFLLSDYASEITGATIEVNGGEWVAL